MDMLTKLKQKQQREIQHMLEYEKIQRQKELQNNEKLMKNKQKLQSIKQKQMQQQEMMEMKAKLRDMNFKRTLQTEKQILESKSMIYKGKVNKTMELLSKYEHETHPLFLSQVQEKKLSHKQQIENANRARKQLEEAQIKKFSHSLDVRFQNSKEVLNQLQQQLSDRHKNEQHKNNSYLHLVQKQQADLSMQRKLKGIQFDQKLQKIEKAQRENEKLKQEKIRLRIELENKKYEMQNEFQNELMVLENKGIASQINLSELIVINDGIIYNIIMIILRPLLRLNKLSRLYSTAAQFKFQEQYSYDSMYEIKQTCKIINQLPHDIIESSCNIFSEQFFPLKYNYDRMIPLIAQVVEQHQQQLQNTYFKQTLADIGYYGVAQQIYEMMLLLIDFLDKANIGFLTGDIHPLSFNVLERELNSNTSHDQLCSTLRSVLFRVGRQYKLPINGIKYPEHENPRNLFERQLILEDESNEIALDKFSQIFENLQQMQKVHNLHLAQKCIIEWFPKLCELISQEQLQCMTTPSSDQQSYSQYFIALSSEKLAIIGLQELMKELINVAVSYRSSESSLDQNQIKASRLFSEIGLQINKQYVYEQEQKKLKIQHKQNLEQILNAEVEDQSMELVDEKEMFYQKQLKGAAKNHKTQDERLKQRMSSGILYTGRYDCTIPKEVTLQLGSLLTYFMIEAIKFRNENNFQVPLLVQSLKTNKKQQAISVLNVNTQFLVSLMEGMSKDKSMFLHLDRSLPMIYPPAKWEDYQLGGYYQRPTNLIRLAESRMQEDAAKHANLSQLYDILDNVSSVPWRINNRVLDVIVKVWENGGGMAEIPKRHHDSQFVHEYQLKECKTSEEKYKLIKKIQEQRDQYSLICDFTLKLGVATAFGGCSKIYYPHNMDFRGRLYPIPPHLNHMGADISRGLLQFADGKPLGNGGLRWLKIHLANKMGKDKLSLDDRMSYVDQNMDMILRCADDPLNNLEWAQAEDAWQSLAAIFDFVSAIRSPDPTRYVSHLHIHQDGSCNGLQHYAALGRDNDGAVQVNLADTKKPGDVYSHVAGMVEQTLAQDAADPLSKFNGLAIKLQNHIKRKIVKQTVMTSVYGVTFIGAREQIHRQLKDKEILAEDDHEQYQASYYLARITLDAIKDLFEGAHKIKQWLIKCATIISNQNQPVSWITPLGLPVIQPYRTLNKYDQIKTVMSNITIQSDSSDLPINKVKQRSAFPPNFIHSLDSTHLMYTSVVCKQQGITFAAVHDSYWTHASNVDRLNEILRDQFIRLHSQPLLEELRDSFQRRYPQVQFPPIPDRGTFDLERVKKSVYFFA